MYTLLSCVFHICTNNTSIIYVRIYILFQAKFKCLMYYESSCFLYVLYALVIHKLNNYNDKNTLLIYIFIQDKLLFRLRSKYINYTWYIRNKPNITISASLINHNPFIVDPISVILRRQSCITNSYIIASMHY